MKTNYILIAATIIAAPALSIVAYNTTQSSLTNAEQKILEQFNTPCNGEIQSTFAEDRTGWALAVHCNSKNKDKAKRDIFEGMERRPARTDGFDPFRN